MNNDGSKASDATTGSHLAGRPRSGRSRACPVNFKNAANWPRSVTVLWQNCPISRWFRMLGPVNARETSRAHGVEEEMPTVKKMLYVAALAGLSLGFACSEATHRIQPGCRSRRRRSKESGDGGAVVAKRMEGADDRSEANRRQAGRDHPVRLDHGRLQPPGARRNRSRQDGRLGPDRPRRSGRHREAARRNQCRRRRQIRCDRHDPDRSDPGERGRSKSDRRQHSRRNARPAALHRRAKGAVANSRHLARLAEDRRAHRRLHDREVRRQGRRAPARTIRKPRSFSTVSSPAPRASSAIRRRAPIAK